MSRTTVCALVTLLGLGGLGLLGNAVYIHAKAILAQWLIAEAWQQAERTGTSNKPWPWADTWPVARLSVPRLGIRQYVLAGDSGQALAFGPGLAPNGATPGQQGASIISGHRDTHFSFLRQLQFRDWLELEDLNGDTTRYQVLETRVIDTRDTWLYPPPSGRHLLLVTCYPFDALQSATSLRYVVSAVAEESAIAALDSSS